MTKLLMRLFLSDQDLSTTQGREACGKLAGAVGIAANAVLCILKLVVGALTSSISITADAVNNLSDAGSSIITLIGFRMSGKPADRDHPFGHARMEYISGLVVSFLILFIGIDIGRSSLDKIIHPARTVFLPAAALVLVASIGVKLWMMFFNRTLGREIRSTALEATAADSRNDVLSTSAVLLAMILSHYLPFDLDGWMGLAVAAFILISGIRLVKETLDPLLGQAPSDDLVRSIERKILSYEGVLGIHDLLVHSYGPGCYFASVHAEMDANRSMLACHDVLDRIERDFLEQYNIRLVIHLDPLVMDDEVTNDLRERVRMMVRALDERLTIHDFRVITGETAKNLVFDVVVPADFPMKESQVRDTLCRLIEALDPGHLHAVITVDQSYVSLPPNQ